MAGQVSPSLNQRAIILFTGDPRREELRKGLPPRFLRLLHRELIATIRRVPEIDLFVVNNGCAPAEAVNGVTLSYPRCDLVLQMHLAVDHCRSAGYESILVLAGDILGITAETLTAAFARLQVGKTAVIGESGDGGFYLAAFNSDSNVQWENIPLHTHRAAVVLRQQLRLCGLRVVSLPRLNDIDSLQDAHKILATLRLLPRANRRLRTRLAAMLALPLLTRQSNRHPASLILESGLQLLRAPPPV